MKPCLDSGNKKNVLFSIINKVYDYLNPSQICSTVQDKIEIETHEINKTLDPIYRNCIFINIFSPGMGLFFFYTRRGGQSFLTKQSRGCPSFSMSDNKTDNEQQQV